MNKKSMTLGSLFDGSGGFPLGGLISGITPLWASEVEPFPIRVTSRRIPQMKHLGDISGINGAEVEPVDIITFGSPCQDMSVAGKRSGLDGERSCLFYEAIRIVKEMRCKTNGQYPRYIVWENVPGAFSSNAGEDFKAVLEAVASVKGDYAVPCPPKGKWTGAGEILGDDFSIAWRCVDAQFWGVPQRRRRIYLVADFNGGCAGKILFESEGLFRNLETSRCPWKGTSGTSEESTPATGIVLNDQGGNRMDVTDEVTCTLRAEAHHPPCVMESAGFCTEHSADSRGIGYEAEKSPTLRAGVVPATVYENHSQDTRYVGPLDVAQTVAATYGTGGNNQPFVVEPTAFGVCSKDSNAMKSANPNSGFYKADTSRTLDGNGGNPTCNQGGIAIVEGNGSRPSHHGNGYAESDVMYTLNTVDRHAVVYAIDRESYNCGQNFARNMGISDEGVNSTLKATGPDAVAVPTYSSSKASFFTSAEEELANTLVATDYKDPPLVNDTDADLEYIVRRLTPTECARLQGFPDWWCDDLGVKLPSEEELTRWAEIFETHRKIVGTSSKPKTRKQIFKWLQNPHSDSAEYKMWGNGVSLPNVVYVLTGIVYYTQKDGGVNLQVFSLIFCTYDLLFIGFRANMCTTKTKEVLHMKIHYIVPGKKRKELAQTIADWLGETCRYKGVPSCAYEVDYFTIDREGNLLFDDMADSEVIENLLEHLHDEGFEYDSSQYDREPQDPVTNGEEPMEDCPPDYLIPTDTEPQDGNVGLTVAIPLDKVSVGNLTNLLDAKGSLIKKALGIDATPIEIGEDRVSFSWFGDGLNADEVKAYSHFIAALCEMSRNQKRINSTEKAVDNEKYAFRCFLLRLGFIGNEYKTERKILLRNLSGNSAFKAAKTEKTYRVELDDDNFKIFTAADESEADRIGQEIAEEYGSGYCLVEEVAE